MSEKYMLRALEVSQQALDACLPNPPVGCVFVENHQVVSEGYTQPVGGNHAEVEALNSYKGSMDGVTVYVTLEPCSFVGRTPSCANTLIESGAKHVVISMLDPDPRNSGRGLQLLAEAGIFVEVGLCDKQVSEFLSPYLSQS